MKNIFLSFLFITISSCALGQEIVKITFTSKQHDESPTKQGRPEFKIEYIKGLLRKFYSKSLPEGQKETKN
jgi:hypothetical protein